jgi:hypothetical protein
MSVFTRDLLRRHRREQANHGRKLLAGRQVLLVIAYLRKGETYADLACGLRVRTSTVYRYLREAIGLLAAMAPSLEQAIEVAQRRPSPIPPTRAAAPRSGPRSGDGAPTPAATGAVA